MKLVHLMEKTLVCPTCGEHNTLHHEEITVYAREDDDDVVQVVEVNPFNGDTKTVTANNGQTNNPSPRRNALSLTLSCETCPVGEKVHTLHISQHKGATLLWWAK